MFFKILQISLENTRVGVFLIKLQAFTVEGLQLY